MKKILIINRCDECKNYGRIIADKIEKGNVGVKTIDGILTDGCMLLDRDCFYNKIPEWCPLDDWNEGVELKNEN